MTESKDETVQERVVLDRPERQNLLGLLMQNILATNIADEAKYSKVRETKADVLVQAGEMTVTLRFENGRLTIITGPTDTPKASVSGDMVSLLGVASGGGIVGPFLRGAIRVRGNMLLLLKILPLIRREEQEPQSQSQGEDNS